MRTNRSVLAYGGSAELALIAGVPFYNSPGNHEGWSRNTQAFTQAPRAASRGGLGGSAAALAGKGAVYAEIGKHIFAAIDASPGALRIQILDKHGRDRAG
ncbi:MAG: hypothetical protein ACM3XS_05335 [Bacteroidota bacterium]